MFYFQIKKAMRGEEGGWKILNKQNKEDTRRK